MTPSKGDPDHAVKLSGGCAKYVYIIMCMCSAFVCIHACIRVCVCVHKQAALYRCYAKSPL